MVKAGRKSERFLGDEISKRDASRITTRARARRVLIFAETSPRSETNEGPSHSDVAFLFLGERGKEEKRKKKN